MHFVSPVPKNLTENVPGKVQVYRLRVCACTVTGCLMTEPGQVCDLNGRENIGKFSRQKPSDWVQMCSQNPGNIT